MERSPQRDEEKGIGTRKVDDHAAKMHFPDRFNAESSDPNFQYYGSRGEPIFERPIRAMVDGQPYFGFVNYKIFA